MKFNKVKIMEFIKFPKIPRLSRDIVVTEKIDGTNAQICISKDGLSLQPGSRNRWITPENDNDGFAKWCETNKTELLQLGPGRHFGEWWGQGIKRNYGLTEKRFSLFNVHRWENKRPTCCHVVPVLYRGIFNTNQIENIIEFLRKKGSLANPGFMNPEGIVVFHVAGNFGFKKAIVRDELPKSLSGKIQQGG
jgi:hypothetical protein